MESKHNLCPFCAFYRDKSKKYSQNDLSIQSLTAYTQYPRYDEKILYIVCDIGNDLANKNRRIFDCSKIKVLACPFCGTSSHNEIVHVNAHCGFYNIYFWCKTCDAKAFAFQASRANTNEIESKYLNHPALDARGTVLCKTNLECISSISTWDLLQFICRNPVENTEDVIKFSNALSEYGTIGIEKHEIFKKYKMSTKPIDTNGFYLYIRVDNYNLEKPKIQYPNVTDIYSYNAYVFVYFADRVITYIEHTMPWSKFRSND